MDNIMAVKCSCGAVTLTIDHESWSIPQDTFDEEFPGVELEKYHWGSCDYCVNHWGTNLCACGSGELFDECEDGWPDCGRPHQDLEDAKRKYYEQI